MKIGFHGAAGTVTGSKFLLTLNNGTKLLIDCGMFQGEGPETRRLNSHFGFNPIEVDFLILTHAHIDHIGLVPALVKNGFKGKIFATPATKDLAGVMLTDSAEIQEEDAREAERRNSGSKRVEPLYTVEDVKDSMQLFHSIPYNEVYNIAEGVQLTFTDAGHILGSAAANLEIHEDGQKRNFCFSGDIGRYDRDVLCDPQPFPQADYILLESTYGNKVHQPLHKAEELFKQAVLETCGAKRGKLIIPAFSLGRTQELVYFLNKLDFYKEIPDIKVFVDSPLSIEATEVVKNHPENFDKETREFMKLDPDPFHYPSLKFIEEVKDSIALNKYKGPCIIIASSGMMEAGRIRHHLIHTIEDERNTIMITSFMPPDSLGARLLEGDRKVQIWDRLYDVKADVITLQGLSAHADKDELLRFLECQDKDKVRKIFLVHGEHEQRQALKNELYLKGFMNVTIPMKGDEIEV